MNIQIGQNSPNLNTNQGPLNQFSYNSNYDQAILQNNQYWSTETTNWYASGGQNSWSYYYQYQTLHQFQPDQNFNYQQILQQQAYNQYLQSINITPNQQSLAQLSQNLNSSYQDINNIKSEQPMSQQDSNIKINQQFNYVNLSDYYKRLKQHLELTQEQIINLEFSFNNYRDFKKWFQDQVIIKFGSIENYERKISEQKNLKSTNAQKNNKKKPKLFKKQLWYQSQLLGKRQNAGDKNEISNLRQELQQTKRQVVEMKIQFAQDIQVLKSENKELLTKLENMEQLYAHLESQMLEKFQFEQTCDNSTQSQERIQEEFREDDYDEIIHYSQQKPQRPPRDYLPNTLQIVKTEQEQKQQEAQQNNYEIKIFEWGLRQINGTSIQYQGDVLIKEFWDQVLQDNIEGFIGNRFDVILTDAPWDSTALKLNYNTLNDGQIMNCIPIEELQRDGYLFMWITNKKLEVALKYLEDHDYERIEIITWVKMKKEGLLRNNIGYYLRHFTEFCLVAKKKGSFHNLRMISHTHNAPNIIVEQVRQGSRKPDQLYEIIETMCPHGKYLEIFGRAHNQRQEWTTIGNESIRKFIKRTKEQKIKQRKNNCLLLSNQVIHSID